MVRIKFRTLSWPAQAITEVNGSTKFAFPKLIGRIVSNCIMKRRANNDKDKDDSVTQKSDRNGSLRIGWCCESSWYSGSVRALGGQNLTNEEIIRSWYGAWEKKDLGISDTLLADNFTFSSAAGDDHISKINFQNAMLGHAD